MILIPSLIIAADWKIPNSSGYLYSCTITGPNLTNTFQVKPMSIDGNGATQVNVQRWQTKDSKPFSLDMYYYDKTVVKNSMDEETYFVITAIYAGEVKHLEIPAIHYTRENIFRIDNVRVKPKNPKYAIDTTLTFPTEPQTSFKLTCEDT